MPAVRSSASSSSCRRCHRPDYFQSRSHLQQRHARAEVGCPCTPRRGSRTAPPGDPAADVPDTGNAARPLPAGFMVCFTLALALFKQDSYDDVADQLVRSFNELGESIPDKSSFTRARRHLGPPVLETLFRALAGPLAAVDPSRVRRIGQNGQPAEFPQARVVTLTECRTHAQIDAAVGGFNCGEPELAITMADAGAGMLVIMVAAFPGWRCGRHTTTLVLL
jgi:hypothetical protein